MPFKPLSQPRVRLADQVYDQIMQAIRAELGDGAVFDWYWQCATRVHHDQDSGFDLADATVVRDHPRLLVLGLSLDQVFVMKLFAGRAVDTDDLRQLWPHTSFGTAAAAVTAFEAAYPHEDPDPNLADWLDSVVGD